MSIKLLARELYRSRQAVEKHEKALAEASADNKPAIEEALRQARAEKHRLRRLLDGQIER
jgi:predicted transcriptional regulator